MSGSSKTKETSTPTKSIPDELRWIDILAVDESKNSALMIGIRDNKEEVVKFIIERAINLNKLSEVSECHSKIENVYYVFFIL